MACTFSASEMFNIALKFLSTSASLAAILIILRPVVDEVIRQRLSSYFAYFFDYFITRPCAKLTLLINEFITRRRNKLTLIIYESDRTSINVMYGTAGRSINEVYDAAYLYLPTRISSATKRLRLIKTKKQKDFAISIENNEEIVDDFQGIKLNWRYKCMQSSTISRGHGHVVASTENFFELSFDYKFKGKIIDSYLPHVLAEANQIKKDTKVIKIYNCGHGNFSPCGTLRSMNLEHPATFDTVAIDPELKKMIIDDLERFVKRREFYKKVGKAWKRGYLLYGPPGTGKSSLIAAMANYLKFDIYDLELASISSNSSLRNLLSSITNQSIVVIEDIDCSIKIPDRTDKLEHSSKKERLTLSGILNFIDGLWSSGENEKIIVFTTNDRDSLDPALLRPGRMDMQISLSYCTPCGFRFLAENYIGIKDHELFGEIEEAIRTTEVTPAEVAEELMRNNNDPDALLNDLIQFLKVKKRENEKAKAKKNRAEQESTPSEGGQTEEEEIEQK